MTMTPKQFECLKFIHEYTERHGISPAFREIQEAMGLKSISQVCHLVEILSEDGWVMHHKGARRTLRILRVPPVLETKEIIVTDEMIEAATLKAAEIANTGLNLDQIYTSIYKAMRAKE